MLPSIPPQSSSSLSGLGDQYLAAAEQMGTRMEVTQMRLSLKQVLKDQEETLHKLDRLTQGSTSASFTPPESAQAAQAARAATPGQVEAFKTDLRHCASCNCTQTSTPTPTRRLTPPLK